MALETDRAVLPAADKIELLAVYVAGNQCALAGPGGDWPAGENRLVDLGGFVFPFGGKCRE